MSLINVNSSEIHLFPSSMRTGCDPYSRFTTELNLVDIVNRVSTGKFVTGTFKDDNNKEWVDFTLLGYHFNVLLESTALSLQTDDELYAIAITGYYTSNENKYDERLRGWDGSIQADVDNNGKFIGLSLTKSQGDYTTLKNSLDQVSGLKYTCDYIKLGRKTSTTFVPDADNAVANIESIPDAEINTIWNSVFN